MRAVKKYLIAGLGNPGPAYAMTRHNAGFYFLDAFARRMGWRLDSRKLQGEYSQGRLLEAQLFCVKPQTFMNLSGQCLRAFLAYFDIPLANLLVIHDDLDLTPGRLKVAGGGSHGGHNGLRSIIDHVGSRDFARLRIGIGRPLEKGPAVVDYVLGRVDAPTQTLWNERQDLAAEAIELFVGQGIEACMNGINARGAV